MTIFLNHEFVRHHDPSFGSMFGGGCAQPVYTDSHGWVICGCPEFRHPPEPPLQWMRGGRSQIVTLCGSTRFRAEMTEANRRLTLAGYLVFAPGVFAHDGDEITDVQKAALDRLHFQKIDRAAWIYVVNPGGYIGESTRREVEYAIRTGKTVQYLIDQSEKH